MALEERLRNKLLYKLQLYILKVIPMVMALICLMNDILSYYDIDLVIFSYIGSCSILMLLYLYISSYVFKFCEYHRMFLHYVAVNLLLNTYDVYIGVPVSDRGMLSIYLAITGIFIFIILYLYVKTNKRHTDDDSK